MSRNRNKKSDKKKVTVATLLANESPKETVELLQKYGISKPSGYGDAERKLEELYMKVEDKVQFEKEMAAIHPHKNWLFKRLEPVVKVEEVKVEEVKPVIEKEEKSMFEGAVQPTVIPAQTKDNKMEIVAIVSIVSLVTVLGITLYAMKKS